MPSGKIKTTINKARSIIDINNNISPITNKKGIINKEVITNKKVISNKSLDKKIDSDVNVAKNPEVSSNKELEVPNVKPESEKSKETVDDILKDSIDIRDGVNLEIKEIKIKEVLPEKHDKVIDFISDGGDIREWVESLKKKEVIEPKHLESTFNIPESEIDTPPVELETTTSVDNLIDYLAKLLNKVLEGEAISISDVLIIFGLLFVILEIYMLFKSGIISRLKYLWTKAFKSLYDTLRDRLWVKVYKSIIDTIETLTDLKNYRDTVKKIVELFKSNLKKNVSTKWINNIIKSNKTDLENMISNANKNLAVFMQSAWNINVRPQGPIRGAVLFPYLNDIYKNNTPLFFQYNNKTSYYDEKYIADRIDSIVQKQNTTNKYYKDLLTFLNYISKAVDPNDATVRVLTVSYNWMEPAILAKLQEYIDNGEVELDIATGTITRRIYAKDYLVDESQVLQYTLQILVHHFSYDVTYRTIWYIDPQNRAQNKKIPDFVLFFCGCHYTNRTIGSYVYWRLWRIYCWNRKRWSIVLYSFAIHHYN